VRHADGKEEKYDFDDTELGVRETQTVAIVRGKLRRAKGPVNLILFNLSSGELDPFERGLASYLGHKPFFGPLAKAFVFALGVAIIFYLVSHYIVRHEQGAVMSGFLALMFAFLCYPVFWGGLGNGANDQNLWNMGPWKNNEALYILKDDFSKVQGAHDLKFGVLFSNNRKNEQAGGPNSAYQICQTDDRTGNVIADTLLKDIPVGCYFEWDHAVRRRPRRLHRRHARPRRPGGLGGARNDVDRTGGRRPI
jgi:hypothetical protein